MWRITFTSPWLVDNGRNRVRAFVDYAGQGSLWDATGTPGENLTPDPNLCVGEGIVPTAVLDAMEADPLISILTSEELVDG